MPFEFHVGRTGECVVTIEIKREEECRERKRVAVVTCTRRQVILGGSQEQPVGKNIDIPMRTTQHEKGTEQQNRERGGGEKVRISDNKLKLYQGEGRDGQRCRSLSPGRCMTAKKERKKSEGRARSAKGDAEAIRQAQAKSTGEKGVVHPDAS